MPCHLSAVFSGLSGPLVTEFYFKDKAQKERTANKSFLTEPGKMINCETVGFGAEEWLPWESACLVHTELGFTPSTSQAGFAAHTHSVRRSRRR